MSDYKRFVSYFYPYTPDKQPRSIGFIKIEVRDKKMKIEIQVKGIPFQGEKSYPVYLVLDDEEMKSYDAGNLRIQKNSGFFRGILVEGSNGVEEFLFANTVGAYIQMENEVIYVAYWGKRQLSVTEILESFKKKEKRESKAEEPKEIPSQEMMEKPEEVPSQEMMEKPEEVPSQEIMEKPEVIVNIEESLERQIQEDSQVEQVTVEKDQIEEMIPEMTSDSIEKNKDVRKEQTIRKEEFEDEFAKEQEFFENPQFFECQKIEPKDLRLLPTREWILGKNSFLLHGYYNYRYLLYGKLKRGGNTYRFLGVPGIFHNQEKFMANLFGFSEFEPVKHENSKTGKFGYWIRIIDKI